MDNAKSHNSKSNVKEMKQLGFKGAIRPSYSHEVAPFDLLLSGWPKGELARRILVEMDGVF
jgi:hypothetical protein